MAGSGGLNIKPGHDEENGRLWLRGEFQPAGGF
jgi:hypothetical protein